MCISSTLIQYRYMSVLIRAQALPLSFSSSIPFSYMFVHSFFLSLCVVNFIFGWLSAWVAAIVSEIWHKFLMIWILSTVVWALVGRASHGIHNMHIYISFPFHSIANDFFKGQLIEVRRLQWFNLFRLCTKLYHHSKQYMVYTTYFGCHKMSIKYNR